MLFDPFVRMETKQSPRIQMRKVNKRLTFITYEQAKEKYVGKLVLQLTR